MLIDIFGVWLITANIYLLEPTKWTEDEHQCRMHIKSGELVETRLFMQSCEEVAEEINEKAEEGC